MVTMTDLKEKMRVIQRAYEQSEDFDPSNPSMDIRLVFYNSDGGLAKFLNDRADNWYIAGIDTYTDAQEAFIYIARYADADEVA